MSLPEVLLWRGLKGGGLNGLRFRRQHPLGPYVLDFYCAALRLCIEVDGAQHGFDEQAEYDRERDAWLASQGVRVIRLPAAAILENVEGVVAVLAEHLGRPPPPPPEAPPPLRRGGP